MAKRLDFSLEISLDFSTTHISATHEHRRQLFIGWQRIHHRRIPTNNVARIRSKSIEKPVSVVKSVLSLRRN